jgi:hypothetical protein
VRLGPPAIVRLKGPLAHGEAPSTLVLLGSSPPELVAYAGAPPHRAHSSGPTYGTDRQRPGSNRHRLGHVRVEQITLECARSSPAQRHAARGCDLRATAVRFTCRATRRSVAHAAARRSPCSQPLCRRLPYTDCGRRCGLNVWSVPIRPRSACRAPACMRWSVATTE